MLLSKAILLGISGGRVKNCRTVFLVNFPDEGYCGCVIGTALCAIGYEFSSDGLGDCHKEWPWTAMEDENGVSIAHLIASRHYNSESRESIAVWVAEKERELGIVDNDVCYMQIQGEPTNDGQILLG